MPRTRIAARPKLLNLRCPLTVITAWDRTLTQVLSIYTKLIPFVRLRRARRARGWEEREGGRGGMGALDNCSVAATDQRGSLDP